MYHGQPLGGNPRNRRQNRLIEFCEIIVAVMKC